MFIYTEFTQALIAKARKLYTSDAFAVELDQIIYALDATIVDLCLSLFPWAQFRKQKGAVKIHEVLNLRRNIPSIVVIVTPGKIYEVNILNQIIIEW